MFIWVIRGRLGGLWVPASKIKDESGQKSALSERRRKQREFVDFTAEIFRFLAGFRRRPGLFDSFATRQKNEKPSALQALQHQVNRRLILFLSAA